MRYQPEDNPDELIELLLEKLEVSKPSTEEMLAEIGQAGLVIKLEDADVSFFEKHRNEMITSMWKVIRLTKILKRQNVDIDFNAIPHSVWQKSKKIH